MLDINKRVRCEGTTVAEMIEALQRLPQDGIVHFEGKKNGYIHCDPESGTIDFDTNSLDDMYDEASCGPKDYYLVDIDVKVKETVAVKVADSQVAKEKVKNLYQLGNINLRKKTIISPVLRCTKTLAENYEILEEDV